MEMWAEDQECSLKRTLSLSLLTLTTTRLHAAIKGVSGERGLVRSKTWKFARIPVKVSSRLMAALVTDVHIGAEHPGLTVSHCTE
jgi:hypothetical protein